MAVIRAFQLNAVEVKYNLIVLIMIMIHNGKK